MAQALASVAQSLASSPVVVHASGAGLDQCKSDNACGFQGVYLVYTSTQRWQAGRSDDRTGILGYYSTPEEAALVYADKCIQLKTDGGFVPAPKVRPRAKKNKTEEATATLLNAVTMLLYSQLRCASCCVSAIDDSMCNCIMMLFCIRAFGRALITTT